MSKELEHATDLTGLLEEPNFLDVFCGGCKLAPDLYFEECSAGGDPRSEHCPRRSWFLSIEETLKGAQEDIIIDMRDAGCVA